MTMRVSMRQQEFSRLDVPLRGPKCADCLYRTPMRLIDVRRRQAVPSRCVAPKQDGAASSCYPSVVAGPASIDCRPRSARWQSRSSQGANAMPFRSWRPLEPSAAYDRSVRHLSSGATWSLWGRFVARILRRRGLPAGRGINRSGWWLAYQSLSSGSARCIQSLLRPADWTESGRGVAVQ